MTTNAARGLTPRAADMASGMCCVRPSGQVSNSPGQVRRNLLLRDQSDATVLHLFGL